MNASDQAVAQPDRDHGQSNSGEANSVAGRRLCVLALSLTHNHLRASLSYSLYWASGTVRTWQITVVSIEPWLLRSMAGFRYLIRLQIASV